MNSYFYMTQTKQNCILHKAIHFNAVKTIYNVTIKKNTQAATQRYSAKTCKFRAKSRELSRLILENKGMRAV